MTNIKLIETILDGIHQLDVEALNEIFIILTLEYKCGTKSKPVCKNTHVCNVLDGKCATKASIGKYNEEKLKKLYGADYLYDEKNGLIGPKNQVLEYVKYLNQNLKTIEVPGDENKDSSISERDKKIIALFSECIFNIKGNK